MLETELLKLTLLRHRLHTSIYGHVSSNSRAKMSDTLTAMHAKLSQREDALVAEEDALDRKLGEYNSLLGMVDGEFKQIVHDYAAVMKETENCKKDLRRMGWTGDA